MGRKNEQQLNDDAIENIAEENQFEENQPEQGAADSSAATPVDYEKMFDLGEITKKIMLANINYLLKEKGMKIGELESAIGVSTGYISRLNREGSAKPGLDFLVKVAKALDVSYDVLLSLSLIDLTPTEQYLDQFVCRLIKQTKEDEISWNAEKDRSRGIIDIDDGGWLDCNYRIHEYSYDVYTRYKSVFKSHYFKGDCEVDGNELYYLKLDNGCRLYIVSLTNLESEKQERVVEIWMVKGQTRDFVCGSGKPYHLAKPVNQLYAAVVASMQSPKIKSSVKAVIDAFMSGNIEAEEEDPLDLSQGETPRNGRGDGDSQPEEYYDDYDSGSTDEDYPF